MSVPLQSIALVLMIMLSTGLLSADHEYANVEELSKAVDLRDAGQYEAAQRILDALLDDESDGIPVRFEQARLAAARGDTAGAIRWLHRVLDLGGVVDWSALQADPLFAGVESHADFAGLRKRLEPCSGEQFEQVSQMAGNWQVISAANPHGPPEFFNVRPAVEGCAYFAEFGTVAGYRSVTLIFYDPETRLWHQRGVDSQGFPTHFVGEVENGQLVLESPEADVMYRSTFRWKDSDHMQNIIVRSQDGGATWGKFFTGEFRRTG